MPRSCLRRKFLTKEEHVSFKSRVSCPGTCATGFSSQENRRVAARSSPQLAGGETLARHPAQRFRASLCCRLGGAAHCTVHRHGHLGVCLLGVWWNSCLWQDRHHPIVGAARCSLVFTVTTTCLLCAHVSQSHAIIKRKPIHGDPFHDFSTFFVRRPQHVV